MLDRALKGDLRERVDGGFEGWCWAPDRPDARLVVDLLVNDTLAASIVAAVFRRDLQLRGIGDGRHGFALRLPPNLAETTGEHIVTARDRATGVVFGRVLRGAADEAHGGDRLAAIAETMDGLWQRLETVRAAEQAPAAVSRLRDALGILAGRLAARHAVHRAADDVDPGVHADGQPILLPHLPAPVLSIVLRAASAPAALRCLAALAPAADLAGAEFIVVDPGLDPFSALLPARVRNVRYVRDTAAATLAAAANVAAAAARGTRLLVLGETTPSPSAASLLALARAAARAAPAVLLGQAAAAAMVRAGERPPAEAARLRGRLGVAVCIDRALWRDLGPLDTDLHDGAGLECADLAFRARLLGLDVRAVAEPAAAVAATALPAPTSPTGRVAPAEMRRALAAFTARWGVAALDPAAPPA
jgi:hypothetical protein